MPARSERLYLYPDDVELPGRVMDFPVWWDRRAFFETFGARDVDLGGPFHVDYGLLLSPVEAMEWDERCAKAFAGDERIKLPAVADEMRRLREVLPRTRWVIVESYEWESGLD